MTKEKPILFSTEMVRAILDGRKTQTRRTIKEYIPAKIEWITPHDLDNNKFGFYTENEDSIVCKYGKIGDRLWVKETYAVYGENSIIPYEYKANFKETIDKFWKWKPSIFMPRKASRITLEIINIRVERLNDISEQDAIAEGVTINNLKFIGLDESKINRIAYKLLWESINGQGSWEQNPWVWVIEFKRVES